jgi:hypothetical protein
MSLEKRKAAILRGGADRELVLIFNADLREHHLKVGEGIPPPIFRSMLYLQRAEEILKVHKDLDFYLLLEYFDKVLARNNGVLPPTPIEL